VAVGVVTIAATARAITRARKRRVSVWWDVYGPPTVRYLDEHIANLRTLGISGVSIMLTEIDGSSTFTDEQLATFTAALRSNGISYGFDVWSHPTQAFVASLPELIRRAVRFGAQYIEFDTEWPWSGSQVRGYSSLEEAGKQVAQAMVRSPVPWGITTVPGRPASVTLGKYGSFVVPQAYSKTVSDEPQGALPGSYQSKAYRLTKTQYGSMPMVMGLAAFHQDFPEGPPAAMTKAFNTAFGLGVREVRYWSWKYIGGCCGTGMNDYAYNAVGALVRSLA
jgi:hypothetical protein